MIKTIKILILFTLLISFSNSHTQEIKMNKEVKEMILLGKDSIVQIALALSDKKIDVQNFSKIKVVANSSQVYVSFLNPIKYLPMKSVFYFDFIVEVIEKTSSYGPIYNGISNSRTEITFYKETAEAKKNIQIVLAAIAESDKIEAIDMSKFEDTMIIRENENHYETSIVSETHESVFKIAKKSGKIYDVMHAHLEPVPYAEEDKDVFKEIH